MNDFSFWYLVAPGLVGCLAYAMFRQGRSVQSRHREVSTSALREAQLIVNAYGKVLEYLGPIPGATVADEDKLPFPKPKIKAAILIALVATTDAQQREFLKVAYLSLADFQARVSTLPKEQEIVFYCD